MISSDQKVCGMFYSEKMSLSKFNKMTISDTLSGDKKIFYLKSARIAHWILFKKQCTIERVAALKDNSNLLYL